MFKLPPTAELQAMTQKLGAIRDGLFASHALTSDEWFNLNRVHNLMVSLTQQADDVHALRRLLFALVSDQVFTAVDSGPRPRQALDDDGDVR